MDRKELRSRRSRSRDRINRRAVVRLILLPIYSACVTNTECHTPNDLAGIRDQVLQRPAEYDATFFEVENETTLRGSARLAANHVNSRIGVLNFASANPGGGFRGGAGAGRKPGTKLRVVPQFVAGSLLPLSSFAPQPVLF